MVLKKTLIEGMALAAGTLLGNVIFVPMIFHGDFVRGLISGVLAAMLVLVTYYFIAFWRVSKE